MSVYSSMADWNRITREGNVVDRRGMKAGGLGLFGIIAMLGIGTLLGINPLELLGQMEQQGALEPAGTPWSAI